MIVSLFITRSCCTASSSHGNDSLINSPKTKDPNKCPRDQDKQWFCFNSTNKAYSCDKVAASGRITCSDAGPVMEVGNCATYDENTRLLSIIKCSNQAEISEYNSSTAPWYIQLPTVLTELNDYMCGPLNRKGLVCSECADGFGPSVTSISFGYRCAKCTNAGYGVLLFLSIKLVPITVLYLVILAFQIRVTSAPMPCFILYAQSVITVYDFEYFQSPLLNSISMKQNGDIDMFAKVIDALYGVFRLEFFHFALPPLCVSSRLKPIHVAFLGYVSILYPILLIFLTWLCVELHGRNFRLLVWLWRPFHRCFVRLRRGWDTKSDIIDVFITFLFLSCSTVLHQMMLILRSEILFTVDASGACSRLLVPSVDRSLTFNDIHFYLLAVPSLIMFFLFILLPPLLLMLYPMKAFQSCLSKCHLNSIALNIFIEKVQSCYKNGVDGERDMRSFSGLYFLLQLFAWIVEALAKAGRYFPRFFLSGILASFTALIIALVRPYKKTHMACLDTLILYNLAVVCFIISLSEQKFPILQILVPIPIVVFTIVLLQRKLVCMLYYFIKLRWKKGSPPNEPTNSATVDSPSPLQPMIHPTSTPLSYGTIQ